jgi:nucleoid-associated protein YgaU
MRHRTRGKHHRITTGGKHRAQTHRLRAAATASATLGVAAGVVLASTNTAAADPNWTPIIACESGGNATAQNPASTASGLFQFLDSSWIAYGGGRYASRAKDATPAQQYEIANRAYAQSGLAPWSASQRCWSSKVSTNATPQHAAPDQPPGTVSSSAAVPKHAKPEPRPHPSAQRAEIPADGVYIVVPGDTLSGIATDHGIGSWEILAEINRALIPNPDLIYPGQRLALR